MKKLVLAAAISATVSVGAQAVTYSISSNILGSQVFTGGYEVQTSSNLIFGGVIEMDTSGEAGATWSVATDQLGAKASLSGTQGVATGATELSYFLTGDSSSWGIVFNGGYVDIESGGAPYDTIDASEDNIHFDSSGTWLVLPIGGIDMSGGNVNGDGTITIAFNGLWTGPQPLSFFDGPAAAAQASGSTILFGGSTMVFLDGELTLTAITEVPIPTAAWLFGSALLGLVGIRRKE